MLLTAEDERRRLRRDDMRGERKQPFQHGSWRGVGVEYGWTADCARRRQGQSCRARPAHVDQDGVECGEILNGKRFGVGLGELVIERNDNALAMRVDQDGRQCRPRAGDAPDKAAIDAFGLNAGDQLIADEVVSRARPQRYVRAEAACGAGSARSHARDDLDAVGRDELALTRRKRVDAKDRIERQRVNTQELHRAAHLSSCLAMVFPNWRFAIIA